MNLRGFFKEYRNLILSLLIFSILYFALYDALNQKIFSHSVYDSYTLQAQSWWQGKTALDQNYSHLELATYNNRIFVSFPPVPSVVMFALVPFFGGDTPSNLMTTSYAFLSFIFAYLFLKKRKNISDFKSLFWAAFLTFGGNLISVSVTGGVWFQAQTLAFLLTVMAIYFTTSSSRKLVHAGMACWALAVGCRPFQLVYFPVFLVIIYNNMKKENPSLSLKDYLLQVKNYLIAPVIIGSLMGLYNFIRFGNPAEFGHNYLPEFINSENGQFSLQYVRENLGNIFRLPDIKSGFKVDFPRFNGWAFYIVNPLFIAFTVRLIMSLFKKVRLLDIVLPACIILHIFLTLCHKTLGGWQFGARYFADMLPIVFLYISFRNVKKVYIYEVVLFLFGAVLNTYGALWLFLDWK